MDRKLVCKHYDMYGVKEYYELIKNNTNESEVLAGFHMELLTTTTSKLTSVTYFKGGWGKEYEESIFHLDSYREEFYIENTRGRSSHQYHPFFILNYEDDSKVLLGYAWSGNWYFHVSENGNVSVGQTKEMFTKELSKDQELRTPSVLLCSSKEDKHYDVSAKFHQFLKEHWIPQNASSNELLVEWNHWWTYEDAEINEDVFIKNVDRAKELGIELCTLDAGWYGDTSTYWSKQQGDWKLVNKEKFPNGLRYLADYVHNKGMKFGIWMEPEALGLSSKLRKDNPRLEALINGKSFECPYICLGNPNAASLVYQFISELVEETNADFIKLDFNLDPEFGCNRTDHGHGAGDGLFEHYQTYYKILDRIRERFPDLIIENCASGGLRCDLGMLQHVHTTFLSDVDVTKHSLEAFYQLSQFVPPSSILHWAWSQTREYEDGSHVFTCFEADDGADEKTIKYILRAAMLHQMGICRNLPAMTKKVEELFKQEISFYKSQVRKYILEGQLYHLLLDDGMACFQFQLDDKSIIFCFNYNKDEEKSFYLKISGLNSLNNYRVSLLDKDEISYGTGKQYMEQGVYLDGLKRESSEILIIERDTKNETI